MTMREVSGSAANEQQVMRENDSEDDNSTELRDPVSDDLLIPSLAALVVRLARMSLFEGKMVSGNRARRQSIRRRVS